MAPCGLRVLTHSTGPQGHGAAWGHGCGMRWRHASLDTTLSEGESNRVAYVELCTDPLVRAHALRCTRVRTSAQSLGLRVCYRALLRQPRCFPRGSPVIAALGAESPQSVRVHEPSWAAPGALGVRARRGGLGLPGAPPRGRPGPPRKAGQRPRLTEARETTENGVANGEGRQQAAGTCHTDQLPPAQPAARCGGRLWASGPRRPAASAPRPPAGSGDPALSLTLSPRALRRRPHFPSGFVRF